MPSAPYIPPRDADYDLWSLNLATQVTASPASFGLVAGDAVILTTKYTTFHAAYLLTQNPATNTSPNVAAKDAARADAEQTQREYCQQIRLNPAVSDLNKVSIGLNLPPSTLTPIPAPTERPELVFGSAGPQQTRLGYKVEGAAGKAKATGSVGVQIVASVGTAIAVDPDAAPTVAMVTKSPFRLNWQSAQVGKIATLWARFYTRSGPGGVMQFGPWSVATSFTIM